MQTAKEIAEEIMEGAGTDNWPQEEIEPLARAYLAREKVVEAAKRARNKLHLALARSYTEDEAFGVLEKEIPDAHDTLQAALAALEKSDADS